MTRSQKNKEALEVEKMTGQRNNYFSTSHASHQYEPRSRQRNRTRPVRVKECGTWTSTACLSGSNNYKQALIGL
jgi:hypothetical protein